MVQGQVKVKTPNWYFNFLTLRILEIDGVDRQLVIPIEVSKEQCTLIDELAEFGVMGEPELTDTFKATVEEIIHITIRHQIELAERYFKRHPDKWALLANPVKITEKELKLYTAVVKLQEEDGLF